MPLEEVFRQRIFDPLGMRSTFLWNDVPREDFGLPKSYFSSPFEVETTNWNMSQGWAAGGVISTADDMTTFLSGLFEGRLFASEETLRIMMEGVSTGNAAIPFYGIGLVEKQPGLWGHGGQTLGFESDLGYFLDEDISVVVWANSARNASALGAVLVSNALRAAGAIPELQEKQ